MNWIEGDFAALRYVVLGGSDFTSHPEQAAAIGAYLRWRNRHAVPKRDFAPDSKIRHPDYTIKVA
ncbi:transposase [Carbonactinospora thermoautotrophica]|uniref:Transposase n=1 Tax=Carbonactinospora thermoautotrophica TaxID=1469144 RepID=A0A132ML98_9ACTN|nr:transposase [Carbonactinospora thermoautotrophica]KWX08097.1 transposase [Carbonactinospora thermoautotrophica]